MKLITVVICTYNRARYLQYALQSLLDQTLNSEYFDIIVIDNNSTDNTKKVVEQFKNKTTIKYVTETKQGLSNARNRAINESNSEYIAYIDDDAKVTTNWIEIAIKIIKQEQPNMFGGPIYPYYDSEKPKWFLDKYEELKCSNIKKKLTEKEILWGSNMFFKKIIFKKIGLFNTKLGMNGKKINTGEEAELQQRIDNQKISRFYYPNLIVFHLVPNFKMKILYRLKRKKAVGISHHKMTNKIKFNLIYNIKELFLNIFKIFIDLLKYPFRNKKKYPYWQNYTIDIIIPKLFVAGRIYLYFKK